MAKQMWYENLATQTKWRGPEGAYYGTTAPAARASDLTGYKAKLNDALIRIQERIDKATAALQKVQEQRANMQKELDFNESRTGDTVAAIDALKDGGDRGEFLRMHRQLRVLVSYRDVLRNRNQELVLHEQAIQKLIAALKQREQNLQAKLDQADVQLGDAFVAVQQTRIGTFR